MTSGIVRCAEAARPARAAWWAAWGATAVAGAIAVQLMRGPAFMAAALAPSTCALKQMTGVACPTCGFTRAFALLVRGEWRASLAMHPWVALLALQVVIAWAIWALWLAGRLGRRPDRWVPHAVAVNLAFLALLWAARFATGTLPR